MLLLLQRSLHIVFGYIDHKSLNHLFHWPRW